MLTYEGIDAAKTGSPREIIKQAYQYYPCIEEDVWLDMLSQRNNMAHIYDGNAAKALAQEIISRFIPAFEKLEKRQAVPAILFLADQQTAGQSGKTGTGKPWTSCLESNYK